jgi:peptide/nickel transport system substrate-binding protein
MPGAVPYDPLVGMRLGATDPDQSRALLRAAGYEPGQYHIDFPYNAAHDKPIASVVAKALNAGGFDAVAHPVTDRVWYTVRFDPEGPYNMRSYGWCPDFPNGYRTLLGQFPFKGAPDITFLNDPYVDSEVDRIAALPLEEQAAAWGEFDKYVESELYPYVVTGVETGDALYGSRVGGLNIAFGGMPAWSDLYVSK